MRNRFLDLGNVKNEEITKIRKTQSSVPLSYCKTDLDFRGHPNRTAAFNYENRFLDIDNVRNVQITEIQKTQSTVPPIPEVDLDFRGYQKKTAV